VHRSGVGSASREEKRRNGRRRNGRRRNGRRGRRMDALHNCVDWDAKGHAVEVRGLENGDRDHLAVHVHERPT
jgi:hypothetical protein